MLPGSPRLTRRRLLILAAATPPLVEALRRGAVAAPTTPAARSAMAFSAAVPAARARAAGGTWVTLPPVRPGRRFQLAGVRWDGGTPPLAAQVRGRRRGGPWTPWLDTPTRSDHAPDGRARRASEPAWTGTADELQIRTRGRATGLEAAFVAVSGGGRVRARAAQAPAGPPGVIPRAAWGGDAVRPRDAAAVGEVQVAFVHHTVSANDYSPQEAAGMVLGIARFHRDHNGWDDLGYNFLVDRYGQVFEGRAGGMDQPVIGAQAQGFNHVSTGIACLGTFGGQPLPDTALEALARTIAWKFGVHGVPAAGPVTVRSRGGSANRYAAGADVWLDRVSGHRDGGRTECPGAALHAQLPRLRERVAALVPSYAAAAPSPMPLSAQAASKRVRSRGRGVLVRGTAAPGDRVSIGIARQDALQRFRFARRVEAVARADGSFAVRVRLARPGVYRLVASASGARAPALYVRSVRGR